jgi:acyl transferase domain-containing protein/NAD(P)H-dependent flavin oxidoreductase YrpB (nitropropane dioxygenase family)/NADP-dependent 3-hydroxy acid dehydrogenase YdfG
MRDFQLIALTPPGLADSSIAVAAAWADCCGVLDLEYCRNARVACDFVQTLDRPIRGTCGVKLSGRVPVLTSLIIAKLPAQVRVAILIPGEFEASRSIVRQLSDRDVRVLWESTSVEEAQRGVELGVHGLIAKGHEAGGRVGEETTFILLQRLLASCSLPVMAQGGIGRHSVAAVYVAGASGVVLDAQLWLTRESPLRKEVKKTLDRIDGSETVCVGSEVGECYRVYSRPRHAAVEKLKGVAKGLQESSQPAGEKLEEWRRAFSNSVGWNAPDQDVWPIGQDAALAPGLAARFRTVPGVLHGLREAIAEHVRAARKFRPLDENSPLARSHNTKYPIVQGPMTRVSDTPEFAFRVAESGGLPFLALALMKPSEVSRLLRDTRQALGERPWGVGILGFVPSGLREQQLEVIREIRPPFALIAGGRPDQAGSLEEQGIPTYLHVPSPALLRMFLENGARRFVFEGRECGGHVGPRSSFVLWESMIEVLLDSLPPDEMPACHVLFAAGIHDALSASMVAALASPLTERGVKIGTLLGTAYLFTREAVEAGAIVPAFQKEALGCDHTVLLETGPGHAIRCIPTSYANFFEQEKQRLRDEGKSAEEIRIALEDCNVGRLRIASKGITRRSNDSQRQLVKVPANKQRQEGMYMIGQLAPLRRRTCSIRELHHDVSVLGTERLERTPEPEWSRAEVQTRSSGCNVAIIGMGCILPKARDLRAYWENILAKVDAITEIPSERWDWRKYYDKDAKTKDKIYSKWGGFLDEVPFDPLAYGMPPNTLPSIEPLQLLTLETVRAALADAGYAEREFSREHASVILGAGGGVADLGHQYAFRSALPMFDLGGAVDFAGLPEWTEDSFPGILVNVAAGRVANRFDLGGVNYTVDAACASSLAAVYLAVRELETGTSDLVVAGGADTVQNPFAYLCFSKTHALSPSGRCHTFDESADGIAISEGLAMLVLKRLRDAERDGDRIYAVIKGIAGSSDGRDRGLTAPRPEGQKRALTRAYAHAGISPRTVALIEAHGTGTVAGDQAEVEALKQVFEAEGAGVQSCALGSVKSMIGHTKCTAGVAGLIKIALSLHCKVLPPTLGVNTPNAKARFHDSPFYINSELRPWIHSSVEHPRRAGVSAFGFGGTNFHAVLEEYGGSDADIAPRECWGSELFVWKAAARPQLLADLQKLEEAFSKGADPKLSDLAYSLWEQSKMVSAARPAELRLSIVADSLEDLTRKLRTARENLQSSESPSLSDPRGVYIAEQPEADPHEMAFLFPGQGSQYPGMLADIAIQFAEVREQFAMADRILSSAFPVGLSRHVFPPPAFRPDEQVQREENLRQTNIAQPALGAADLAMYRLLRSVGIAPQFVAGHSYGEYVALCAAGVISEDVLLRLSEARGRVILQAAGAEPGTMAAVNADRETVEKIVEAVKNVWIANVNSPKQTIISGRTDAVQSVVERLRSAGLSARSMAVSCAFHSPIMAPARDRLFELLSDLDFSEPELQVFSNTLADAYPSSRGAFPALLADHLVRPVDFAGEIDAIYRAGARIFVEVGPRNLLTNLADEVLGNRPHLCVATDVRGRSGVLQLQHALGQLFVNGVELSLDRLYRGRDVHPHDLAALVEETRKPDLAPTVWLVNGGRSRPLTEVKQPKVRVAPQPRPLTLTPRADSGGVERPSMLQPQNRELTALASSPPHGDNASHPSLASPVAAGNGDASAVVLHFNRLMERFLETQQEVMLSYLQSRNGKGEGAAIPALRTVGAKVAGSHAEVTLGSVPMSESATAAATQGLAPETLEAAPLAAEDVAGVPEPPEAAPSLDIEAELIKIVTQRTGYPAEMLGLDLDMEAELGIDSIKRVEILTAFQRACWPSQRDGTNSSMESLTSLRTLRAIIEKTKQILHSISNKEALGRRNEDPLLRLPRFLLDIVNRPVEHRQSEQVPGLVVIAAEEGGMLARAVMSQLLRRQVRAVLLAAGDKIECFADRYTANLADSASVRQVVDQIRQQEGPIAGIIHLAALNRCDNDGISSLAAWRKCVAVEAKSLFYLAKAAGRDLRTLGQNGISWLVAGVALESMFGTANVPRIPSHGAIRGFIKSIASEWPEVRCKVVALESDRPATTLAAQLVTEILGGDNECEVGFRENDRLVLRAKSRPFSDVDTRAELAIDSNSVILVTGGARGITAETACELAKYRPTLLLVGRAAFPECEESPETSGCFSPSELKSRLIAKTEPQLSTPAQIEATYQQLLREREMREKLAAMKQAGATVRYFKADVRDEHTIRNLLEEIYRTYGRLDGVIHGAGIIEDKLFEDKTWESFDRVFDTKLDSAFVFSRLLRPESLKFLAFFSSISGTFGNRGQADYAAANAGLDQLAKYLDMTWPCRVVSVAWGPWEKVGMVTESVQRQFAERGVQIIATHSGARAFDRELRFGRKGEVEVVLGGGPWETPEVLPKVSPRICVTPQDEVRPVMSAD